jgi:hypothetical protein
MTKEKQSSESEELLNTNEVMRDYEFHVRMLWEHQRFDFESADNEEPAA